MKHGDFGGFFSLFLVFCSQFPPVLSTCSRTTNPTEKTRPAASKLLEGTRRDGANLSDLTLFFFFFVESNNGHPGTELGWGANWDECLSILGAVRAAVRAFGFDQAPTIFWNGGYVISTVSTDSVFLWRLLGPQIPKCGLFKTEADGPFDSWSSSYRSTGYCVPVFDASYLQGWIDSHVLVAAQVIASSFASTILARFRSLNLLLLNGSHDLPIWVEW